MGVDEDRQGGNLTNDAGQQTGRRPTWSESRPSVSSAERKAMAYTPKTTVVVSAEKPHSFW